MRACSSCAIRIRTHITFAEALSEAISAPPRIKTIHVNSAGAPCSWASHPVDGLVVSGAPIQISRRIALTNLRLSLLSARVTTLAVFLLIANFAVAQFPKTATTCRSGDANGKCSDGSYAQTADNTAVPSWPAGGTPIWTGCSGTGSPNCMIDTKGMWGCDPNNSNCTLINERPTNVSNVGFTNLLPAGVHAFVHYEPWFCNSTTNSAGECNGHVDLGIDSNSTAQADAVVADMARRGFYGIEIDWFGKPYGSTVYSDCTGKFCKEDGATQKIKASVAAGALSKMVIVYDNGAYKDCSSNPTATNCGGTCGRITTDGSGVCTKNDKIAGDLLYLYDTYIANNTKYFSGTSGRPQIWFFGSDPADTSILWSNIRSYLTAQVPGFNPSFVFDFRAQKDPYASNNADGAWAWSGNPGTACYGFTNSFTSNPEPTACSSAEGFSLETCSDHGNDHNYCQPIKASAAPSKFDASGAFAKFDNRMAPWSLANGTSGSPVKILPPRCGRTWLDSFGPVNSTSWGTNIPNSISIDTWNDYDEGSQIESGIENCWNVDTPSISSGAIHWAISSFDPDGTGPQLKTDATTDTIDHFTVYISGDGVTPPDSTGEHLAKVQDVAVQNGVTSYSLPLPTLPSGTYLFYVQAVGKNSIKNKFSSSVTLVK